MAKRQLKGKRQLGKKEAGVAKKQLWQKSSYTTAGVAKTKLGKNGAEGAKTTAGVAKRQLRAKKTVRWQKRQLSGKTALECKTSWEGQKSIKSEKKRGIGDKAPIPKSI